MRKRTCREWLQAREEGAMAVESMLVLIVLIFFLVFLLSLGILFYQQWAVVQTADDVSTRLGQSYAYPTTDPRMGYISADMKAVLSPYRYIGSKLEKGNEKKGENYAAWLLEKTSLAYAAGQPKIVVETVYDAFAQRHIVVDITAEYEIPLGAALTVFGISNKVTYHATGRAMCMDISDYLNSVNTANALCGLNFSSKIYSMIDSVLGLINTIREAGED